MATTTDATNGSEETFEDEQGQHPLDSREDEEEDELLTSDEADGVGSEKGTSADAAEKKRKKIKLRRLKRKSKARAYEFGGSGCVGIVYLEIGRITDLPPERNGKLHKGDIELRESADRKSDEDFLRHGSVCCRLAW